MAGYEPDFYDRSDLVLGMSTKRRARLRCRVCRWVSEWGDESMREPVWLDDHVGETFPCPNCALDSRIPTIEESEWPQKKDRGDPVRGKSTVER